jgi:hypothetical protein
MVLSSVNGCVSVVVVLSFCLCMVRSAQLSSAGDLSARCCSVGCDM